ncbi:MAG: tetratricopeptide repeat protein [Myxococcota bacterium]|nr:tetratricopeptide repeat protein [Myxococcota bacterium]
MKTRWLDHASVWVLVIGIGFAFACASQKTPGKDDPTVRITKLLDEWVRVHEAGGSCASGGRKYPFVDCGRIQAAIVSLGLEFPNNPEVLLVNAVIAYETHQPENAESYLDALLEQDSNEPGVAVLRSRLALDQGNLPHARRLLNDQVTLTPDAADLREALASVHYLSGDLDSARRQLLIAERLGAPTWRVAFNRGLLEEAEGNTDSAIEYYQITLDENPEYKPARSRLRGLKSEQGL